MPGNKATMQIGLQHCGKGIQQYYGPVTRWGEGRVCSVRLSRRRPTPVQRCAGRGVVPGPPGSAGGLVRRSRRSPAPSCPGPGGRSPSCSWPTTSPHWLLQPRSRDSDGGPTGELWAVRSQKRSASYLPRPFGPVAVLWVGVSDSRPGRTGSSAIRRRPVLGLRSIFFIP